jgi:hypothetical protein
MPRSITAPQTGSMVWYFSAAGAPPLAAIVTQTIDAAHFNLFVLSQVGVGSAILNVNYSLVGMGAGQGVSVAAVAAGGTGYAVNDTITLANGVVLKVLTVGATPFPVATVSVVNSGNAATPPANPQAQVSTSGAGTGATFTLTWTPAYCTYMRVNEFLAGNAPDGVMAAETMAAYNAAQQVGTQPQAAKANPHPRAPAHA